MSGPERDEPRFGGSVRRALDEAMDATVGRAANTVSDAARGVTEATAEQVIENLEPYLIAEVIPRIVEGITPYLVDEVIPEVLTGATPRLAEDLIPPLLVQLQPFLERELVPQVVDALLPHIEANVAPALIDALMPKIRAEIVPMVLDDIVDDPKVRDLIREQSQGLILDAFEHMRRVLAEADDLAETIGRGILLRRARVEGEAATEISSDAMVAAGERAESVIQARTKVRRVEWSKLPLATPPPGRDHAYAGAVTRGVAFGVDMALAIWVIGQGLSSLINVLDSLFEPTPEWLSASIAAVAAAAAPMYFTICWWLVGRTAGSALVGIRVCTPDGRRLGLLRALARAWLGLVGIIVWAIGMVMSLFDPRRRGLLDRVMSTEVRYVVPEIQQRRHIRDALAAQREEAQAATTG